MEKAIIFDIERNSFVNGPGIRTVVFFKGCNLHCAWCHNPESQSPQKEILFYASKCTGCGRCRDVTAESDDFVCFHDAKEICGRDYTVDEVLEKVMKDQSFYQNSGGGVTFSGGECMLRIDFLCEILKKCKENGIHTAVDTAGHVPWEYFERVLPYTDLFLYDVKCLDAQKHKTYTGVGNERILANLQGLLAMGAPVWVRIPIIPTVNDSIEEMHPIKHFLARFGGADKVELLPYHAMGEHKYAAMGQAVRPFSVPSEEKMAQLKGVFS